MTVVLVVKPQVGVGRLALPVGHKLKRTRTGTRVSLNLRININNSYLIYQEEAKLSLLGQACQKNVSSL